MTRTEQRAAERAHKRIVLELQNRAAMLAIHGGILVGIGLMMMLTGGPAPSEAWFGPWSRLLLGGAAVFGGGVLLVGVARGDDDRPGWYAMVVGVILACLWHLGLAGTYVYAVATEHLVLLSPGEALDPWITSRGYIPLVYLGYVLLTIVHATTLLRLGPPPR